MGLACSFGSNDSLLDFSCILYYSFESEKKQTLCYFDFTIASECPVVIA